MTWRMVAAPHVGHRMSLRDPFSLKCHDCAITLVIPRDLTTGTTPPPRFEPPPEGAVTMPPNFRETYEQARKRRESA